MIPPYASIELTAGERAQLQSLVDVHGASAAAALLRRISTSYLSSILAKPTMRVAAVVRRALQETASPLTLLGATGLLQWCRSNTTLDSGGLGTASQLTDLSGAGLHYTAATTARPAITAAGLNGRATLLFNGTANLMTSTLNLPAPGTTPTFTWMVFRQRTNWVANASIIGGSGANTMRLRQVTASPILDLFNGNNGPDNAGAALNTWVRMRAQAQNTVADYLRLGSTLATGIALGNSASIGRQLGGQAGTQFAHLEFAELFYRTSEPSATQLTALDTYAQYYWGTGVTVG